MRGLAAAALMGALVLPFVPTEAGAAKTIVTFDDLPAETTVSDQYLVPDGLLFRGPEQGDGLFPVVKAVAPEVAHSGGQVADISTCAGCELFTPRTVGRLSATASGIEAFVGFLASSGEVTQALVTLNARDAAGQLVGTSSATVFKGEPFDQRVSVTSPGATIASFELVADPPFMSQTVGFDDLLLEYPNKGAPPDFALEVGSAPVAAAPAVDVPIVVHRLNGSNGNVTLSVSGVPPGIGVGFSPNPVPGTAGAAILQLSADPGAAPSGDVELTITGTPDAGAGSVPRTVKLPIRIAGACGRPLIEVRPAPGRRVFSAAELDQVLRSDYKGRVVVPAGEKWELLACDDTPLREIPIQPGIELVGEAGPLGRRPLLFTNSTDKRNLFFACTDFYETPRCRPGTEDVRVEGLHLRGPYKPKDREGLGGVDAIVVDRDPAKQQGRVVVVDNEIDGFKNAVTVRGTVQVDEPRDYNATYLARYGVTDCPCPHPDRRTARAVRVERNYLHNLARKGGGYGVVVGGAAYATVTGNVFEYNNHSLAASGRAYSGYVARFNYLLKSALDHKDHHFDVHGTLDDEHHAGGPAGTFFDIAYNTIRGEQTYALGTQTRAVFGLRGRPADGARLHHNVFVHDGYGEALKLEPDGDSTLNKKDRGTFNLSYYDNKADTDYSTEIAAGNFDGDRHTDVFVANGTGWFFSPAGVRPWEFLDASSLRTKDLAFADIDNDGMTDVIWRRDSGRLGYLKRGTAPPVNMPSPPVPLKELRFGDFDGDRRTDIFYTRNRQWRIWYGATQDWADAQSSITPISQMLFGEFDGVTGTDVTAVRNNQWSYSSGAVDSWDKLNSKRASSFANAVAADFDGNGKTDIAFGGGQKWRYSPDGRKPLASLRNGTAFPPYPSLRQLLVGHFTGGRRATVVSWLIVPRSIGGFAPSWRLVIWGGLGSPRAFVERSEQNMR